MLFLPNGPAAELNWLASGIVLPPVPADGVVLLPVVPPEDGAQGLGRGSVFSRPCWVSALPKEKIIYIRIIYQTADYLRSLFKSLIQTAFS